MQSLTHVTRLALFIGCLLVSTMTHSVQQVIVDETYCDGVALLAKAGTEAKQRGESLSKWRQNLLAMKGYGVRNQDNVLYRVLPQAIDEVNKVYRAKQSPIDTYITSFNACMSTGYGRLLSLK